MITGFIYRGFIIHPEGRIMQDINTAGLSPEWVLEARNCLALASLGIQPRVPTRGSF